jgi:acetyl-CoA synthetase
MLPNTNKISAPQFLKFKLSPEVAEDFAAKINYLLANVSPELGWQSILETMLNATQDFDLHAFVFSIFYPTWQEHPETAAVWFPNKNLLNTANIAKLRREQGFSTVARLHAWSVQYPLEFWQWIIIKLKILFLNPPAAIAELTDLAKPNWLVGAEFNIVESCFNAQPEKIALIFKNADATQSTLTYQKLQELTNRVANSLTKLGYKPGTAIAMIMPMTESAVAIYLGIIQMGGVVVSIADSFSAPEIKRRLEITKVELVFTQEFLHRDGKKLALYERIILADAPSVIVLGKNFSTKTSHTSRKSDLTWEKFLVANATTNIFYSNSAAHCNILFSSGTTAEPKAIPWTHTTPIKAAADAYFHQDLQANDVLAWHSSPGWMMGPWSIFAALINGATLAIYEDVATTREYGEFITAAGVTILGVTPSIVARWRESNCMANLDWNAIRILTNTGECSNPIDMLYLMFLAGYKPIIEYCGGTEIGGAYLTSTVIETNYLTVFTTPALGSHFEIIADNGKPTTKGDVAIIPPAIGLSTELLNDDHQQIYYRGMPQAENNQQLRRHGDVIQHFQQGGYRLLGRTDDCMNIGGIKLGAIEIERLLTDLPNVTETAAIAVSLTNQGPSKLVIYAAVTQTQDIPKLKQLMQSRINQLLNPLFKIHEVITCVELPKTASHKILRRALRSDYLQYIANQNYNKN